MSEYANQVRAHKERLQRFAEAAMRHADRRRPVASAQQSVMVDPRLAAMPQKPRLRRQYERPGQPSVFIPVLWRVLRAVADEFNMTVEEIRSRQREREYTLPRYVVIGLLMELTQLSLPAIGRQLGGRDHTTIINGRRRLAQLLESEAFRNRFEQIKAELV